MPILKSAMVAGCFFVVSALMAAGADAPPIPADEKAWIEKLDARMDQMIAEYQKMPRTPTKVACNLTYAQGSFVPFMSVDLLLKYVDALKEAGCARIEFNPAVTGLANPQTAAKYDAMVKHIRELGVPFAINPQYQNHEIKAGDLDAYAKAVTAFAARYHPDILVPIHEPTTMDARMGVKHSPAEWRQFVEQAIKAIKAVSPATKVGAGTIFIEMAYFKEFASIPGLDFLTYDNYGADPKSLAILDQMAALAHKANKPVYMEETGRPHYVLLKDLPPDWQSKSLETYSKKGLGAVEFEPLDVKWLKTMKLYGETRHLDSVTLFRTTVFFTYVTSGNTSGMGPEYNRAVKNAVMEGRRTATFHAFQDLARQGGFGHEK